MFRAIIQSAGPFAGHGQAASVADRKSLQILHDHHSLAGSQFPDSAVAKAKIDSFQVVRDGDLSKFDVGQIDGLIRDVHQLHEFKFLLIIKASSDLLGRGVGRMILNLADSKIGSVSRNAGREASLTDRSPGPVIFAQSSAHGHAFIQRDRHRIDGGGRCDVTTLHARVGSIGGVVNRSRGRRHRQQASVVDKPSVLWGPVHAELGCFARFKPIPPDELVDHDIGPAGEVVVHHSVEVGDPIRSRVPLAIPVIDLVIAPAGRFDAHHRVDLIRSEPVNLGSGCRCQDSVVVEVFLHVVGELQSIFRVRHQPSMESCRRIRVVQVGYVIVDRLQHFLGVPTVKLPLAVNSIPRRVPVVMIPVPVAPVKIDQHVIDELVDRQQFGTR